MSCFCKQEELSDEERRHKERSDGIDQQLRREKTGSHDTYSLLLLGKDLDHTSIYLFTVVILFFYSLHYYVGAAESGKSTVVKQMKILHLGGFSTE